MNRLKSQKFWEAVGVRALRTFCQAALAAIGTATVMEGVDWSVVLSSSCLAAILSALMSLATGLPEVEEEPSPVKPQEPPEAPPVDDPKEDPAQEIEKPPDIAGCAGCFYLGEAGNCLNCWETICRPRNFAWKKEKETISSTEEALDLDLQEGGKND